MIFYPEAEATDNTLIHTPSFGIMFYLFERYGYIMRGYQRFSVLECEAIEKVRHIGEMHGNSPELKEACQEAYRLYREGKISSECYGKIYSEAFDNYLSLTL